MVRTWSFRFMCEGDHLDTNRDYNTLKFSNELQTSLFGAEVRGDGTSIRDCVFGAVYPKTVESCFLFFTLF